MHAPLLRVLPILAAALLLPACAPGQGPTPTVESAVSPRSADIPAAANDTDIHFLGMMVPHHQQAIDMSDILLASDVQDPQVRDLAQRIRDGQQRENTRMNAWADEWGIDADMELHSHHIANGMITPDAMADFARLEGEELRTRFLELMYVHHDEVIRMTRDEVDNGGYLPLRDLAGEMIEIQTAEMREMEQLHGGIPQA